MSIASKIVFAISICGFFAMVLAADITGPNGAVHTATVDDFMPHKVTTDDFNENWSYQFVFDNGTRAFVSYALLRIPGTGRKVTTEITFWNFKGKTYTVGRQYPPERLVAKKAESTIDIKGEYLMEHKPGKGHRVMFSANKNGKFLLDVTFESAVQGLVPGNGTWSIGKEKFAQYIHIPYGRVAGKIAYNDDTLTVKGYAYMDQTWQTVQATEIAERTMNFSTNSKAPLYAGRLSIVKGGNTIGYVIHNDANGAEVLTPKSITDNGATYDGKKFARGDIEISWNEGNAAPLKFNAAKPFQKASILDKVDGWIAKKAFKIAAGGEILFYRGRSDTNDGKKLDWAITGAKD